MKLPFELFVALRFLREGRFQTGLVLGASALGVTVLVFLSALITGIEQRLIDRTLGSQAHVLVRANDEEPRALDLGPQVARDVEPSRQRDESIGDYKLLAARLATIDGVDGVSPSASGPGAAVRGTRNRAIQLRGIDPDSFTRVYRVQDRMVRGEYALSGREALIGQELANDLALGVGDHFRIEVPGAEGELYTVRGIFDLGSKDVNQRWVLVPLRAAQSMLGLGTDVTAIEVHLEDIFEADRAAEQAALRTGLTSESWMATNVQLLSALNSQRSSKNTLQFFITLAVAMGIASVLVVSVVQKTQEIGILRATGTSAGQILRVFLWQGLIVGFGGALVGCAFGMGLTITFTQLLRNLDGTPLLPIALDAKLLLGATLLSSCVGLLAAALPSRRAAGLDPAKAIRNA